MDIQPPIPLIFDSIYLDYLIKELLKDKMYKYKVIYLGFRPIDSYDLHDSYSGKQTYTFKFQYLKQSKAYDYCMREKLRENKGLFNQNIFNGKANGRPFLGMNPDLPNNSIVFDSYFESWNLDFVIKVK